MIDISKNWTVIEYTDDRSWAEHEMIGIIYNLAITGNWRRMLLSITQQIPSCLWQLDYHQTFNDGC